MKNKINKKFERQVFSNSKGRYIVPVKSYDPLRSLFLLPLTRLNNNENSRKKKKKMYSCSIFTKQNKMLYIEGSEAMSRFSASLYALH